MQTAPIHPTQSRNKIRDLTYIALMAALMAICSWITIPLGPVPFTMQTFAVFAALLLLGGRRGTIALLLFLCLGCVGLPVFSGFTGGPGILLGTTGGYLIGFVLGDLLYWLATSWLGKGLIVQIPTLIVCMVTYFGFGTFWFYRVYTAGGEAITLGAILTMCVVPFIVPDVVKIGLAVVVSRRIIRFIH